MKERQHKQVIELETAEKAVVHYNLTDDLPQDILVEGGWNCDGIGPERVEMKLGQTMMAKGCTLVEYLYRNHYLLGY